MKLTALLSTLPLLLLLFLLSIPSIAARLPDPKPKTTITTTPQPKPKPNVAAIKANVATKAIATAVANPTAPPTKPAPAKEKYPCRPLKKGSCYFSSFDTIPQSGYICGYCLEGQGGEDVLKPEPESPDDPNTWAFRLNVKTGACCTYGPNRQCSDNYQRAREGDPDSGVSKSVSPF